MCAVVYDCYFFEELYDFLKIQLSHTERLSNKHYKRLYI